MTALFAASGIGLNDVVKLLLDHGANIHAKNKVIGLIRMMMILNCSKCDMLSMDGHHCMVLLVGAIQI